LFKISQTGIARIARNGHRSTLRIAHQFAEPTSALTGAVADCSAEVGLMGWVAPVRAPIVSGFRTPDRPTHDGVVVALAVSDSDGVRFRRGCRS